MSGGRVLRIALPGLADLLRRAAAEDAVPRLAAAEWLVARGRPAVATAAWRDWLLEGAGLGADVLERFPSGPCAVATRTGPAPAGHWARAEPVHLLTAIDHLQLAAPVPLPLDVAESDALLATLNDHVAGSGFALHAAPGGGWVCQCPPDLRFATTEPSAAVGRNLRDVLPTGRDAVRVRVLVNELQMLLHEHPVNERREARGQPVVNSVWLWGAGAMAEPCATPPGVLLTDDHWLAGLWCRHGGSVRPVDDLARVLDGHEGEVRTAMAPPLSGGDAVEALLLVERSVLGPVRAAFAAGRLGRVELHVGDRLLRIPAGARWAFWRRARPLAEVLP